MSLQARAEQGLLEALAKPRKSAATVKVIGRGEIEIPDKEVLKKWRKNHEKQQILRTLEEDHDAVASLNHQPIDPALRHKEFPKLAQKRIDKRTTHDLTVKQFESTLVEISDELEVKVIDASRAVQQGIGACDQTIADIFAELNQDLWLVTKDHQFVLNQWNKIDAECENRKLEIAKYGSVLEEIEGSRASMVAGELRALVETLTSTAFKPPTYIERLVEAEAFELNTVLIVNRQSHAELLALMEKQHIIVSLEARTNWEIRQSAWRQLRHNRCVREFHDDLNSKIFTNPPKRISIFDKMKNGQSKRHQIRLLKLEELMKLKLPSSSIVEQVSKGFEELNTNEDLAINDLLQALEEIRIERQKAAEERRESLRGELHEYGALEDEPDLNAHANVIENVLIVQTHLDNFFRSAGGLKPELKELMLELRDKTLIYDKKLEPTIKRVQVLICGLEVPRILESQGKSGMRSNLIDSLERLKNATKVDVPSMLPVLLSQVNELLSVTVLDPLLLLNLSEAYEDLTTIVNDAEIKMGSAMTGMKSSSQSIGVSGTNTSAGGGSGSGNGGDNRTNRSKSIAGGGARSKTGSASKRSMGGTSRRQAIVEQPEVNMLEVRAVQKRLMMLMRTSDLEESFQAELRAILKSLRQKARCNIAIDSVVISESTGVLAARNEEYLTMTDHAVRFLERNTSHVHEMSIRISSFFKTVAVILEEHALKDEDIDITSEDSLAELSDEFKDEDEIKENKVTLYSQKLKHAADERELEDAYSAVLAMLDKIDASYYKYHATATQVAALHPTRIQEEATAYMGKLCTAIGLEVGMPFQSNTPSLHSGGGGGEATSIIGGGDESASIPYHHHRESQHHNEADLDEYQKLKEEKIFSIPDSDVQYPVKKNPCAIVDDIMRPPPDDDDEGSVEGSVIGEESNQESSLAIQSLESVGANGVDEGGGSIELNKDNNSIGGGGEDNSSLNNGAMNGDRPISPPEDNSSVNDRESIDNASNAEKVENGSVTSNTSVPAAAARTPWFTEGFPPPVEEPEEEGETVAALSKGASGGGNGASGGEEEGAEEEDAETKEAFLKLRDECFIPLAESVLFTLTPEQRDEYDIVFEEVKAHKHMLEKKALQEKRDARIALFAAPPPIDPDGNPVALSVSLPKNSMIDMITKLRNSLIKHSETYGNERLQFGNDLCNERQTDFTEELEERLRLHWPRKGRVEVKIRQVREGQLIAHRQRAQRHGRVVREKCMKQHLEFEEKLSIAASRYKYFSDQIKSLELSLPSQESLAALQGLEGKCRKMVQGFREECEETLKSLHLSTTVEPNRLYLLSTNLLKTTHLFGYDGDYSEFEYQELQHQLQQLNNEIEESVKKRLLQLDGLVPRSESAFSGEKQFMKRFELALQELSLREAIGMKYGAPRRNAQERLRTEQTCDSNSADAVDVLLDQLEVLCKDCKVFVDLDQVENSTSTSAASSPTSPTASSANHKDLFIDTTLTIPRSAVIRENLKTLRALLYRRASYLEFLPNSSLIQYDKEVNMEENLSKKDESALKRAVPQFVPTLADTMQQALDLMEEKCRSETRKLYEDEGKADTLGPAGVPDALQEWLTKCRIGILGDGGHRDKSRRRLREQVERCEFILAKEPIPCDVTVLGAGAAMVEESSVRSMKTFYKVIKNIEKSFKSRYDIWNSAKEKHQLLLRPQMGRPDAAEELNKLNSIEKERIHEVLHAIDKVRHDIIMGQIEHVKIFVSTITEQTSSALILMDTMVLLDDLGYLPGDELIEKKRKSLKRLRKLQRTQDNNGSSNGNGVVQDAYEKPDGRHCSSRTWPPLPIQELNQLFIKHNISPSTPHKDHEEKSKNHDGGNNSDGDNIDAVHKEEDENGVHKDNLESESGGGGGGGQESNLWITELEKQFGVEGPRSVVTTAHRQVIRGRDSNWERFISNLDKEFTRLDHHFSKLKSDEMAWKETWLGHIKNLVRDNEFVSR